MQDFRRDDVTDLSNWSDKLSTTVQCKLIRLGKYCFSPTEEVVITSKGIFIVAPLFDNAAKTFDLHIFKNEVVKVIAHFTNGPNLMLCLYTFRKCAQYIKNSLNMEDTVTNEMDAKLYFSATGPYHMRKIVLQLESITEQAINVIKSIWEFLDEISFADAQDFLDRAAKCEHKVDKNKSKDAEKREMIRPICIYPAGKGGITITISDYMCLEKDIFLNDVIIEFYLKWIYNNILTEEQRSKTFIFSTFFYERLTSLESTKPKKRQKNITAQQRHANVQNWTKNMNIFEKDFIIVPINEASHWYLAIICFPYLRGPVVYEDTNTPNATFTMQQHRNGKKTENNFLQTTRYQHRHGGANYNLRKIRRTDAMETTDKVLFVDKSTDSDSLAVNHLFETVTNNNHPMHSTKEPLILIFNSMLELRHNRVVTILREYLQEEYKAKMWIDLEESRSEMHIFDDYNMPGYKMEVPQQSNYSDCGLYLLQYVEQFFTHPIKDYRLPIRNMSNWFDLITVTSKRQRIAQVIQQLAAQTNKDLVLPELIFPNLCNSKVQIDCNFDNDDGDDDDVDVDAYHNNLKKLFI